MSEQHDLGRRTWSALIWSYGGAAARALLQLVFQLVLARLLGPESFGQAALAMLVLSFGWILSEAGFGSALVQKEQLTDADVRFALGWVALLSGALGLLIVMAAGWLAALAGEPGTETLLVVAGCLVPIQAVCNIPTSLMRRRLQARQAQTIFLGGYALCYGLIGIPAALAGAGPWALLGAFGAHSLFHLLVSWRVAACPWRPTLRGDRGLFKFGLRVTMANMGNWASENIDRFLISRFWGASALGAYGAAANLSRAPVNLIMGSMQGVSFASASRVQQSEVAMRGGFLAMLNACSVLAWPMLVGLAIQADAVVHLLYGQRWAQAGPLFGVFALALIPVTVLSVTGPLLWALNKVTADVQGQVIAVLVLVAGLVAFAHLPLESAVWVVPVAYGLRTAWMAGRLARAIQLPLRSAVAAMRGGVVLSVLVACIAYGASRWGGGALLTLVLVAVLGLGLGLGLLRWLPGFFLPALLPLLDQRAADSAVLRAIARWLRR